MRRYVILPGIVLIAIVAVTTGSWESLGIAKALLCGWFAFLCRTLPRVEVSWPGVATGVVYFALLIVLVHLFARWCCRTAAETASPPRPWRFRWTLSIVATLVLMFVVAYATIGLARHVGWLCSSPEPIVELKVIPHYKMVHD